MTMKHKETFLVLWALCCLSTGVPEQLTTTIPSEGSPTAPPRPPASAPSSLASPCAGRECPQCAPEVGDRCRQGYISTDEYFYTINGHQQIFTFAEGDYFKTSCAYNAIDDAALPRFARPLRFPSVQLTRCGPPAGASYAAALRRLNVLATRRLVLENLPAAANVTRAAFAAPPALLELELATVPRAGVLALQPGALDALPLRALNLDGVRADRLPPGLLRLRLHSTNLTRLPAPLDHLEKLELYENQLMNESSVEEAWPLAELRRLRQLTLSVPLRSLPPLPAALENVTLHTLQDPSPPLMQNCPNLIELTVGYGSLARPVAGWVAACVRLRTLALQSLPALAALPPALLTGAAALRVLRVTMCPLATLPADLFDYSPDLEEVDFSRNKLESLPKGLFGPLAGSLRSLDLSYNRLRSVSGTLPPLTALRTLLLAGNPLGDLCAAAPLARSALAPLRLLRRLSLSGTGLTRLCADWLEDMQQLQRADLTRNRIEAVQLTELNRVKRQQPSELDLTRNPLRAVLADADEVDRAADLHPPDHVTRVLVDSAFNCTCEAYELWRALRARRVRVQLEPRCAGGEALRAAEPERLACALPAAACAPHCRCALVPHRRGLEAECARPPPAAWLRRPPAPLRTLRLRAANLTALPASLQYADRDLQYLDLDDNRLTGAGGAAAAWFAGARRVRLTRNPLACGCGDAAPALRAHRHRIEDLVNTTCADGRALADALAEPCAEGAGVWAAALVALAAAALAVAALAALLASAELRLRIKAVLHARGVGLRWRRAEAEAEAAGDAARPFDVFVSHAPADERWVLQELAPRLQRAGLRLCLRARDWPPGAWIPEQIDASVAGSRRTLGVVSPAWAGAAWAAAELRAAHAAALTDRRPRLLLLLRAGAPPPPHVRAPALRWGEPCFWEKLLYALPDPRPPTKRANRNGHV